MAAPPTPVTTTETIEKQPLRVQVLDTMGQLMARAFGLIAALAWTEAIKKAMSVHLASGRELRALLIFAVVVTIVAVVLSLWIASAAGRARKILVRRRVHAPPNRRPTA